MVKSLILLISLAFAVIEVPITYNREHQTKLRDYIRSKNPGNLQILPYSKLHNNKNLEYSGTFKIGFPVQDLDLVIDTTSGYMWVPAPGCYPCHKCDDHFDVGDSHTFVNLKTQTNITYANTSVEGDLGMDRVSIGDEETITAANFSFVVSRSDSGFDNMKADGVIGFSLRGPDPETETYIEALISQHAINSSVFSIYLNDNEYNNNLKPEPRSTLIIGGFSTEYAQNQETSMIELLVDDSSGLWQVNLTSFAFGDDEIKMTSKSAIFDSGSGYISAPSEDALRLREYLYTKPIYKCNEDNEKLIICECKDLKDYPTMTFLLNDNAEKLSLSPANYFLKEDDNCLLLVQDDDYLEGVWRLGGPFLRKFYTIYNSETPSVSLLPAKISRDSTHDDDESTKWIIVFFVVLLIVICIVMSVFLYLFCCRHKMNFDETYKPLYTAKYTLPPHYHRTAVRNASTGEVVPDVKPTSRQNRVFPGIASK